MDPEIRSIIENYKQSLEELGISVGGIVLFGSHAMGKQGEWSDIDLIVISDDFRDMDIWERLKILGKARTKIKRPMEILGYTPEEFVSEGKGTFIGEEIKGKGIELKMEVKGK